MNPLEFSFSRPDHCYRLGGRILPSITQILKAEGLLTEWRYNPEALKRGTWAHSFCQFYDENDLDWDSIPDEYLGHVIAWEKFRKQTCFAPLIIEKPMYHPTFMYAGTADRYGAFPDGSRVIVEIKTGIVQPATALQTAAQEMLIASQKETAPCERKRLAVQLNENGTYQIHAFTNRQDGMLFLNALALFQWKKQNNINQKEPHNANQVRDTNTNIAQNVEVR